MNSEVRSSIEAKFNVFTDFFEVPPQIQPEVDELRERAEALGETCTDAMDFESKFAVELQEKYNGMFMKCSPKAVNMSPEQLAESERIANELNYGTSDKKGVAKAKVKEMFSGGVNIVTTELEQEMIAKRRESMIEAGTFDEYTRASNKVDALKRGAGLLGGLLKKK